MLTFGRAFDLSRVYLSIRDATADPASPRLISHGCYRPMGLEVCLMPSTLSCSRRMQQAAQRCCFKLQPVDGCRLFTARKSMTGLWPQACKNWASCTGHPDYWPEFLVVARGFCIRPCVRSLPVLHADVRYSYLILKYFNDGNMVMAYTEYRRIQRHSMLRLEQVPNHQNFPDCYLLFRNPPDRWGPSCCGMRSGPVDCFLEGAS